jgi:hypothetical protein
MSFSPILLELQHPDAGRQGPRIGALVDAAAIIDENYLRSYSGFFKP